MGSAAPSNNSMWKRQQWLIGHVVRKFIKWEVWPADQSKFLARFPKKKGLTNESYECFIYFYNYEVVESNWYNIFLICMGIIVEVHELWSEHEMGSENSFNCGF